VQVFVGSQNPSADSFDEIEKFKSLFKQIHKNPWLGIKVIGNANSWPKLIEKCFGIVI